MFDLRHKIRKNRLYAIWEPEWFFFVLPGVLFVWAGFIALHRFASLETNASPFLIILCSCVLFFAGSVLSCGRAGLVFSPSEHKWGHCFGLISPFFVFWHPLKESDELVLKVERLSDTEKVFSLCLRGKKETILGISMVDPVAVSISESLAAFLQKSLQYEEGTVRKTFSDLPIWGEVSVVTGKFGIPLKGKPKGRVFELPPYFTCLRSRGPLLLSVFMTAIVYFSWQREELWRSAWGLAASGCVIILFLCALVFALRSVLRKMRVKVEKKSITIEEVFPLKQSFSFPWSDLVYLALLPEKKGFLPIAGRDNQIVLGLKNRKSLVIGESLKEEKLVDFYTFLVQKVKK